VKPLRLLVIGAGHMGRLHAAKVAELGSAEGGVALAGVADPHPERAEPLVARWGGRSATDFRVLLREADAAIVAVPTLAHTRVAEVLLAAGLDVLLEKPIAATLPEAERLVDAARIAGRVLQVGHLEGWNAAFRAAAPEIGRPLFVEAHRLGPFPGRATDVDVVRDLMIHDIDLVQRLLDEEPESCEGVGVPVLSGQVDIANARLRFPGGAVANLTASRVSPEPRRKVRVFSRDGYFALDLLAQKAVVARRRRGPDGAPCIEQEPLRTEPEDALLAQLRGFVAAVRAGGDAGHSADAALRALRTAERVVRAMPRLEPS
jgi:predicted dehydrogenase